jgi:hypothetical protein
MDFVGNCILASASDADCRRVEAKSASRKTKTENSTSTDNAADWFADAS